MCVCKRASIMILLFDMWMKNVACMVQVSSLSDQYVNGEHNTFQE